MEREKNVKREGVKRGGTKEKIEREEKETKLQIKIFGYATVKSSVSDSADNC